MKEQHTTTEAQQLLPADSRGHHGVISAVFQRAGWWPTRYAANEINAWSAAPAANLFWRHAAPQNGIFVEYDRRLAYFAALKQVRFAPQAEFFTVPGRRPDLTDTLFFYTQFNVTLDTPPWVYHWIERSGAPQRRVLIAAELYKFLRLRKWLQPIDDVAAAQTLVAQRPPWKFSALCKALDERLACCSNCAAAVKAEIAMLSGVLRQKKEADIAMEHRRAARWRPDIAASIMALNMIAMLEEQERLGTQPIGVITDAWFLPADDPHGLRASENMPETPGCFRNKREFMLNMSFIDYHNAQIAAAQREKAATRHG